MSKPIIRDTEVDEKLLKEAEDIIANFPPVTGNFMEDFEKLHTMNMVSSKLMYQRNLPNDSKGIDKSKYIGKDFLIVKLNTRVENVLNKLNNMLDEFLDEIFKTTK